MNEINKIKIESHGVSPIHYHLENMSWGFCRKNKGQDIMEYLNVDPNLKEGGWQIEDVMMADFLNTLDFMDRKFLNEILEKAGCSQMDNAEIVGNAGNYYYPHEDSENGLRLAQPDGWIADGKSLILLEAKGYKSGATLNKGQIAKEYLIAESEAQHRDCKSEFFVLFIFPKENIEETFGRDPKSLVCKSFNELQNDRDLKTLKDEQAAKHWNSFFKDDGNLNEKKLDEILQHIRWISWEDILEIAKEKQSIPSGDNFVKQAGADMITKTIEFHSQPECPSINMTKIGNFDEFVKANPAIPMFSLFLAMLANQKTNDQLIPEFHFQRTDAVPLYHFNNGGCGYGLLKEFEQCFCKMFSEQGKKINVWQQWHALHEMGKETWNKFIELEEKRRYLLAKLKEVQKEIVEAYTTDDALFNGQKAKTTRKALGILGESSRTEFKREYFEQRIQIKKK